MIKPRKMWLLTHEPRKLTGMSQRAHEFVSQLPLSDDADTREVVINLDEMFNQVRRETMQRCIQIAKRLGDHATAEALGRLPWQGR